LHYFNIFTENKENEHLIFREFHTRWHRAKTTYPFNQQQNEIIYSRNAYQ